MLMKNPLPFLETLLNNRRAETLQEAVIAVVVLGIAAKGIFDLLFIAIRANDLSQERLVAYSLAQEGATAVEVLIDTNALRFPGNLDECWDTLNATNATDCATSAKIADADGSTYAVYRNVGNANRWMAWEFFENPSTSEQLLYEYIIGGENLWTPHLGDNTSFTPAPTLTPYRRTVTVEQETTLTTNDTLSVISTMSWEWHGQSKSVSSMRKLYK